MDAIEELPAALDARDADNHELTVGAGPAYMREPQEVERAWLSAGTRLPLPRVPPEGQQPRLLFCQLQPELPHPLHNLGCEALSVWLVLEAHHEVVGESR